MHKMHKGENKPGSHSYSSINNFTGHFFILKRKFLFEIVGRRALKEKSDHCAMNSSWEEDELKLSAPKIFLACLIIFPKESQYFVILLPFPKNTFF